MTGMTSVTFRSLPFERVIDLAAKAGLDGIEWGGDVHVPPGDVNRAGKVRCKTEEAGLSVLSYGSYYRLCESAEPTLDFQPVLACAEALHATAIRVWAGNTGPEGADDAYYRRAAEELKRLCGMAEPLSMDVCLEYHRKTLTENSESARRLIRLAGCGNLKTYWQPNPDLSHGENCRELARVCPYLRNVHTFFWSGGNERHRLKDGREEWLDYIRMIREAHADPAYILEFVLNDSPEIFAEDAAALKQMINEAVQ